MAVRHKCFISYHKADENEVAKFIKDFSSDGQAFIYRRVSNMDQNIIDSTDTGYVMRRIRELYLTDSTVTIVLVGKCTWARRYVDWEVASTLRNDPNNKRSGLLAITLPSVANSTGKKLPPRVDDNVNSSEGYARWWKYPSSSARLQEMIEEAYEARTAKAHLVKNSRALYGYNRDC